MSGNNLFGNDNQQQQQQQQEVSGTDALKLLVGEDAKYKTVEDLAKAMVHGQQHITTIEEENATLREQQAKAATMDELLKQIKDQQGNPADQQQKQDQLPAAQQQETPVDIDALLEQKLAERAAKNSAESNKKHVLDALTKKLGVSAAQAYRDAGNALGVDLDNLSATSPQAAINLVLGSGQTTPGQHQNQGLTGGHNRDHGADNSGQNPFSKKAIQARFDNKEIDRYEKHKLENEGLTKLGSAFWD